jgi:hypothetical protein
VFSISNWSHGLNISYIKDNLNLKEPKMELKYYDIFWILIFSIVLAVSIWSHGLIISYIEDKPPGRQSIYDVIARDTFRVIRVFGSMYCLLGIASRSGFPHFSSDLGKS